MYNEEIKQRYIDEKESKNVVPNEYLQRLFSKTEQYEIEYQKDLCNFNYFELIELVKAQNSASFDSLTVLVSHISLYIDWCIENNMVADFQNHCNEISREAKLELVNNVTMGKGILNREDVLSIINQCQNPCDKFIILALFEGIQGKNFCEVRNIKYNDIIDGKITLITGRTVSLSKELINIAEESNNEFVYYTEKKKLPLTENGFVIKVFPSTLKEDDEFQAGRRIYNKVRRALTKIEEDNGVSLNKFLKPNAIFESGRLYFIKENAKKNNMSIAEYLNTYYDDVAVQYGTFDKKVYMFKYHRYLND